MEYCDWGVIKHQTPLKKNPLNAEKIKGSQPLPKLDRNEIGPQTKVHVKSMQTQFKVMKQAVAKCPSVKLEIMEGRIWVARSFCLQLKFPLLCLQIVLLKLDFHVSCPISS